jgi:hypothetical protein
MGAPRARLVDALPLPCAARALTRALADFFASVARSRTPASGV